MAPGTLDASKSVTLFAHGRSVIAGVLEAPTHLEGFSGVVQLSLHASGRGCISRGEQRMLRGFVTVTVVFVPFLLMMVMWGILVIQADAHVGMPRTPRGQRWRDGLVRTEGMRKRDGICEGVHGEAVCLVTNDDGGYEAEPVVESWCSTVKWRR